MIEKISKMPKKTQIYLLIAVFVVILLLSLFVILLINRDDSPEDIGTKPPGVEEPVIEEEFLLVEQPLGYYKNYDIVVPERILSEIENKVEEFPGFRLKNINHVSWAESFLDGIGKSNLSRDEVAPTGDGDWSGLTIYNWEGQGDIVVYEEDKDTLFFRFSEPANITGASFNFSDKESLKQTIETISEKYFSSDFQYKVDDVYRQGNDYKIEYSRVINEKPVYPLEQKPYLLVTPDGRLKEGLFLLAEFEEYLDMQYPLISASEFRNNINLVKYPKEVRFDLVDEIAAYGMPSGSIPFHQKGNVQISSMEMVYPYMNKSVSVVAPAFLLEGDGSLDIEGKSERADFTVIANAIDLEYVYIHPQSYFEKLEDLD